MKANSQLKKILISQTRIKLINILFHTPKEIYYVRELVRKTNEEINSVRRELDNLLKADLIIQDKRANRVYYGANPKSFYFNDLLLIAHKNSPLANIHHLKYLFLSYDFATNTPHSADNIDIVIVGDVSYKEVETLIKQEEVKLNKEINYMIMDKYEFQLRRSRRDQFIVDFFLSSPLVVYGDLSNLNA